MARLLRIYPDMTFTEKTVRTEQDKIIVEKKYTPAFKIGTSVFKERSKPFLTRILFFWKKPRNLLLLVDGSPLATHLENIRDVDENGQITTKPALAFNFGTMKESLDFIDKVVRKSKADTKPISNTQFLVLALLLGAVLMFQFMIMKGITL